MNRLVTNARRLVGLVIVAIVATAVTPAGFADAHRFDESYLYLDVGDNSLSGRVEFPYQDVREVFGLTLTGSPDEQLAELEGARSTNSRPMPTTTPRSVSLGGSWLLNFEGIELLDGGDDVDENGRNYVVLPFTVGLDVADVPQILDITFTPFLVEIDDRNNIALVSNDWKRGVIEEEANELLVLTPGSPSGQIDLGESNQWGNFRSSIDLGVDHIRTGPDHIFFVLVLLLPSVLVLGAMRWRPAPSFGGSLWRVIKIATMFTIAHSITFTLAGLEILPLPPSKLVETIIAASIGAAALHNIRPIFGRGEATIAFVFGLFHGMGFAGLVADLDIDRTTQLVSLLGRNVGIEIGQVIVILVTFPALFLLRRTQAYLPLMYAGSVMLAILAGMWVIERVFENDLNINGGIDAVLQWPRSLVVMVIVTALAAAYRQMEDTAGRLLPVGEEDADDTPEVGDGPTGGDELETVRRLIGTTEPAADVSLIASVYVAGMATTVKVSEATRDRIRSFGGSHPRRNHRRGARRSRRAAILGASGGGCSLARVPDSGGACGPQAARGRTRRRLRRAPVAADGSRRHPSRRPPRGATATRPRRLDQPGFTNSRDGR